MLSNTATQLAAELLAAPVAQAEPRKPLTDEQKENLVTAHFPEQRKRVLALIAAVEKFYGIGANRSVAGIPAPKGYD